MYITLETDYAVRIMQLLAATPNKTVDAKTIAQKTGVSPRFTLKILRKLVMSEIVKSFKGANGGYRIAKKPEDITLLQVIETVEGKYHFSRCLMEGQGCGHAELAAYCKAQHVFSSITEDVREKLAAVNLSELTADNN